MPHDAAAVSIPSVSNDTKCLVKDVAPVGYTTPSPNNNEKSVNTISQESVATPSIDISHQQQTTEVYGMPFRFPAFYDDSKTSYYKLLTKIPSPDEPPYTSYDVPLTVLQNDDPAEPQKEPELRRLPLFDEHPAVDYTASLIALLRPQMMQTLQRNRTPEQVEHLTRDRDILSQRFLPKMS